MSEYIYTSNMILIGNTDEPIEIKTPPAYIQDFNSGFILKGDDYLKVIFTTNDTSP